MTPKYFFADVLYGSVPLMPTKWVGLEDGPAGGVRRLRFSCPLSVVAGTARYQSVVIELADDEFRRLVIDLTDDQLKQLRAELE